MGKKKKRALRLSLSNRVLLTFLVIIAAGLMAAMLVSMRYIVNLSLEQMDQTLLSTARSLAGNSQVISVLETKTVSQELNDYLDHMVEVTPDLLIITVADTDSIRYYHVNKDLLGQEVVGEDRFRVLETGEAYVGDGVGTMGPQRRAFAPVFGSGGDMIGYIVTGASRDSLEEVQGEIQSLFLAMGILLLAAAASAAGILSASIKDSLLGNEPAQMTRNFVAREEVFSSLEEGILSVDRQGDIILANRAAAAMLNAAPEELTGRPIHSVLPSLTVDDVLAQGRSVYNQAITTAYSAILCDKLPIRERQQTIGAVVLLRNKTEATRLAEQLTGSTHVINTLRAHTHEFMNHLHVILGMLQMDRRDEAIAYIQDIARVQTETLTPVFHHIQNPTVAALILGKISHLREQRIELSLLIPGVLPAHSRYLSTRQQVTIIGNLLENAMEAITASTDPENPRLIQLCMEEGDAGLCISVMDTGIGLATGNPEEILQMGYSTKGPDRGTGMAMVQAILEERGGTIHIDSEQGDGTCVTIIVDRPRGGPAA